MGLGGGYHIYVYAFCLLLLPHWNHFFPWLFRRFYLQVAATNDRQISRLRGLSEIVVVVVVAFK